MDWEPIFRGSQTPASWIHHRDGESAACPRREDRRRNFRRRRLRIALCHFAAEARSLVAKLEEKISEIAAHPHWFLRSTLNQQLQLCPVATFISNSPAETEAIGRRFAEDADVGSILALKGELGSGKTLFTKGFVAGMGSNAAVSSPTFTIVHEYPGGRLPVYHFDFFRLEVASPSRGLDSTIIFLATEFRSSNGPTAFRNSFPNKRAGFGSR